MGLHYRHAVIFTAFFALTSTLGTTAAKAADAQDAAILDLRHVAAAAWQYSPTLKSARAELRAVQELYPQALSHWQPGVNAAAGVMTEHIDNSNFSGYDGSTSKDISINLRQPLYRGGRTVAQEGEAEARINAQYALLRAQEQRVMSDAMTAGVEAVHAWQDLQLQKRNAAVYQGLLDDALQRAAGGETTRTDADLSQTRRDSAAAEAVAAQERLDSALSAMEEQTGIAPRIWTALVMPALPLPANGDATVQAVRDASPAVKAAQAQEVAARYGVDLVRGELYPELNAEASWTHEWDPQPGIFDDADTGIIGLRATMPLYEGGETKSRVRAARNRNWQQAHSLRDTLRRTQRGALDDWRTIDSAAQRLRLRHAESAAADNARVATEHEVEAGEKTYTDLIVADEYWINAQSAVIDTQRDGDATRLRLAGRLGLLTPQALGFDAGVNPATYGAQVAHRVWSTQLPEGTEQNDKR